MYFNEKTIIYYDGKLVKAIDANINLYSQSLHYGYAVFEGIRSYQVNNKPLIFKAKEHFERLKFSCETVHIPFKYSVEELTQLTYEVLEANNFTDAYIRPLVVCPPNMGLTKAASSTLIIQAWEWANGYLANSIKAMTSSYERPNTKAFHVEAKVSGHYVNSILASQEAKHKGFDEGILLDQNGYVAEASGANVFFEKEGVFYTPPKGNILPGITRATVFELADQLKIVIEEKYFTIEEMKEADAAFFCGTAAEIVSLQSIDEQKFKKEWSESKASLIQQAYSTLVRTQQLTNSKVA
jgi:branched-chain amino acid aminotransferase